MTAKSPLSYKVTSSALPEANKLGGNEGPRMFNEADG